MVTRAPPTSTAGAAVDPLGDGSTPLTLAEERLQLALEAANAVVWDWDLATGDCACFGNLHAILGVRSDTIRGTIGAFRDRVHPEDRARVGRLIDQAARHRAPFEAECRVVRDDGSVRWVKANGRYHYSPAGDPVRMLGITVDVTARRRAEDERRRWERRFSEFFEALPQTCYFVTPAGRIADLNPAASQAWGYSREELAGKPLGTIIAPELHPRMWEIVEHWKRTGQFRNEEMVVVTKSGERRTVLVSAGGVRNADGTLLHSASVQVDITERKRAEEELLRLNEAVAHMDRVAAMGEMAAALAHEVRQPLTALISNAEAAAAFLRAPEPDLGEVRSALAEIIDDGSRVGAVVRNLRAIFQKEVGPRRELDVNRVVAELGRLATKHLVLRGARLALDLSPEQLIVLGEESLLQQVVVNLVNNGLDAMDGIPAADRLLTIRTALAGDGERAVILVEDRGPGVPPDEIAKLFTRFHTTKRDGLGMGLCVCRNIVASFGGRIGYEPAPERGAVFRVELPLSRRRAV
jgi:two-component system sensor kinase FixL